MKRIGITLALAALLALPLCPHGYAGEKTEAMGSGETSKLDAKSATLDKVSSTHGQRHALIKTRLGEIEIEFLPNRAPRTVQNFQKLVGKGFYDGTTFHRVIPGFMVQGGCPHTREKPDERNLHGTGGPGYTIQAEFNDTKHVRGVVSMARSSDPDSAGSQFFIMVASAPHLDGKYTAFGRVVRGMEVVDQIVKLERDERDNPLEPVPMKIKLIQPGSDPASARMKTEHGIQEVGAQKKTD